eukprot:10584350-Ditylum_brightwellii.AAC.1
MPLCKHCPAGIIKQWREQIGGWNEVINQKFIADMESTCTLQMAKFFSILKMNLQLSSTFT